MKKIKKHIPIIIFLIVLVLFILYLFNASFVRIDNTTLLLLVLLLLAPFSESLRKIKFGEFEAEIEPSEVKKIEKEVNEIEKEENKGVSGDKNNIIDEMYAILENDHILALAKLRMELEKILNKIVFTKEKSLNVRRGQFAQLRYIEKNNLLDKKYIAPIKDVLSICNRAIHGEDVSKRTAENIVEIGSNLLNQLQFEFSSLLIKPTNSEQILPKRRDEYMNTQYKVKTVIPYTENPVKNEYIFTQEELDNFLDNYNEFAEFLVEIKQLEK